MAELLIRAAANDAALLRRLYGLGGGGRAAATPSRIVVDAHTPVGGSEIPAIARRAGVPLLIDPQTFYLQDRQHPEDKWARLPFADPARLTPGELRRPERRQAVIERSIDHQLTHGATAIIPPYVHLENAASEWIAVQAELWRATRRYLDDSGLALPVTAVFALGWRLLHPVQGPNALAPALSALDVLAPAEVALATSKVGAGVKPADRLTDLILMIGRLRPKYPVLAWQQGILGQTCVVAGAAGYETGIGWREKCDLQSKMAEHRQPPSLGGPGPRPVYVHALGHSVPAKTVAALQPHRSLWRAVLCTDQRCCPPAGAAMLHDARAHAVVSRALSLAQLDTIPQAVWRWHHLADQADAAVGLAGKINRTAATESGIGRVDLRPLTAIQTVAHLRRHDGRFRKVA
ncbi:hypothetical protein [Rhodococcus ruber]|uniref:hypothetical protein n=1 Tax=Rhodococcus ruber TaxID=1830 RepID=UPI001F23F221|nr:hypothetical protein [Rhodococcus ruber]MCF8786840.1 hypothetical protein [Rhodococcus ruber]